jgi:hypothetical protein
MSASAAFVKAGQKGGVPQGRYGHTLTLIGGDAAVLAGGRDASPMSDIRCLKVTHPSFPSTSVLFPPSAVLPLSPASAVAIRILMHSRLFLFHASSRTSRGSPRRCTDAIPRLGSATHHARFRGASSTLEGAIRPVQSRPSSPSSTPRRRCKVTTAHRGPRRLKHH